MVYRYMIVRVLTFLISHFPPLRRILWRWWYNRLARQVKSPDWTFMNYGLVWPQDEPELALSPRDETDRLYAQLYHRVAAPGDLAGKNVLEVGAGRGGGAAYVARCLAPAQITAVDISAQAVAFCAQRHTEPNLRFLVGDAESLPFADNSFDAVLNVESSHCYASMPKFLSEVARVLRPGGIFLFADLRESTAMPALDALLAAQPLLKVVEQEDITANISAALEADDERKRTQILELCPPQLRTLFEQFAGLSGSIVQRNFENRTLLYQRVVLQRVEPKMRRLGSASLVETMNWSRSGSDKW